MNKIALAAFVASAIVTTAAFAEPIHRGGSEKAGLVPWYGQSLGPLGIDSGQQSGGRFGGGGHVMGGGQMQGGSWYRRTAVHFRNIYPMRQAAPVAQCCAAPIIVAPRPVHVARPVQHVARPPVYYQPRRAKVSRTCGNACKPKPVCSTCGPKNQGNSAVAVQAGNNSPVTINVKQVVGVAAVAAPVVALRPASVAAPAIAQAPASSDLRTVVRVIGNQGGQFCFVDDRGVTSYSSKEHPVGSKFRVAPDGVMYWF